MKKKHQWKENLAEALEISALCKRYGVPFILNDNVALARQCGADGVHLGQEDMDPAEARRILGPEAIIGVSAHNVAEARAAVEAGADYLGCGAMFATATKTNVTALPKETLRDICAAVPIPGRPTPAAAEAAAPSPSAVAEAAGALTCGPATRRTPSRPCPPGPGP